MVHQYNTLKILVCGSTGMLGRKYISLSSKLFDVIPTSSTESNHIYMDITDSKVVKSVLSKYNPDIIINCSAYTDVDKAEDNKKEAYDINVSGVKNLIKHSNLNTKIIHFSTDYVFNGEVGDYIEDSIPDPLNYYGKTKLESENILISSNRNSLIFRINGLFDFDNKNSFFNWIYSNLKMNKSINVVTDQYSNPTYIDSFVNIINQCIMLDAEGMFHFGTHDVLSRNDFAHKIAKAFSLNPELIKPINSSDLIQIAKRPMKTNLICSKIKNMLDIDLETLTSIFDNKGNFVE